MALLAANGIGVVAADFVLPVSRAWAVDLTVATNDPSKLTGQVQISVNDGALTFTGTAKAADVYNDTVRARVVAGAGGLAKQAKPKAYQQTAVKIVLQDLLAAAGESMSSSASASVLATQLQAWCVIAMPVADAIGLLLEHVGASWRMLADGTFWCGAESWPDSGLTYTLEHEDKAHSQVIITSEAPLLLPGQALSGRNVSYVEHHVDHKTVRTTAWIVTPSSYDRLRDPMVAMSSSAAPEADYRAPYRCKVVAQSGSNLDLIPDDPRLPSTGFSGVPLRNGVAGLSQQVTPGAYVLLSWMGGDPSKPFCALWEGGETVTGWSFGTSPDNVLTKADMTALITALNAATCPTGGGALVWTPPPSFSSNSFKVQR